LGSPARAAGQFAEDGDIAVNPLKRGVLVENSLIPRGAVWGFRGEGGTGHEAQRAKAIANADQNDAFAVQHKRMPYF
jgi:hypothetical protein